MSQKQTILDAALKQELMLLILVKAVFAVVPARVTEGSAEMSKKLDFNGW
jgi:hypothetical protein